jgi:aerobic-type carbon monoxide dehydrogenase small subunit (CoxS/CutS family)
MIEAARMDLVVDGALRSVNAPPHWRLLELLREGLGLTGTKEGCDDGTCGTWVVMVDGRAVRACRTPASEVAGKDVGRAPGSRPSRPNGSSRAWPSART